MQFRVIWKVWRLTRRVLAAGPARPATRMHELANLGVVDKVCLDRVRGDSGERSALATAELEVDDVVAAVEHDHCGGAVRTEEGRCLQAVLPGASAVVSG